MAPEICSVCGQAWTDTSMVQCDDCSQWYHFDCVGVTDQVADKAWSCNDCGGPKYPPTTKIQPPKPSATGLVISPATPSLSDVLTMLEKQQIREESLNEKFEKLLQENARVVKENEEIKRLLIQKTEDDNRDKVIEPVKTDAERYREIVERAARLDPAIRNVKTSEASALSSHSEMSQLAVLMKQAHVEDLPKFSGNTKDWPLFFAVYQRTTLIASIDDVTNVGRLNKALTGEARRLVLDQLTYGLSPKIILETLEERYAKKTDVLRTLSTELMNFPVILGTKDVNLQEFAVALKTYVAQLKALNYHEELKNNLLESMLHEKLVNLPSMYRRWVIKKELDDSAGIKEFSLFVMKEWQGLPRLQLPLKDKLKSKSVNVHTSPLVNDENVCFSCGGSHELSSCTKFKKLSVSKRWELVKEDWICFVCLASKDHLVADCPDKKACPVTGCDRFHHRLLHQTPRYKPTLNARADAFQPVREQAAPNAASGHNLNHQAHAGRTAAVTAKVVAVRIFGADEKFVDDYAFLDDGSTLTMMDRQIADRLGLEGVNESLQLQWTKGITRTEQAVKCDISLTGKNQKRRFTLKDVYCVPDLDLALATQDGYELSANYRHLRNLPLPTFENVKPRLLIGLEHATLLGGQRVIEGKDDEPLASNTKLGWVVYGRHQNATAGASATSARSQGFQQSHTRLARCENEDDRRLHEQVKSFFAVENLGVAAKTLRSVDDERAERIMKSTMKMVNGRYEVGLLWKSDDVKLPDSHKMALKRLMSEEKKLMKDPMSLNWMNEHVKKLVEKGYAREATTKDLSENWTRKWTCPLFTVVNRNKVPPKRRCVADVAAIVDGVSLNSCLLQGPDNLIALPAALCRARENAVMISADVTEMFHQIRIVEKDQQCQRFLWRDGEQSKPPKTYIMQAMMFGPTCSPFQAQYVKNCHAAQYRVECPEAADALERFMYMDDYFNSHKSSEEAVRVTMEAVRICSEMGFDLVQIQSNKEDVLALIPQRNVKQEMVSLNVEDRAAYTSKLLGMYWNPAEDVFVFRCTFSELLSKMSDENYRPTKREVLSALMKIFDPLGLIANYIRRGKSLLQEVWREKLGWDEKLPENLAGEWLQFLKAFDEIEKVKIPRWYGSCHPENGETELVIFVDASAKAYAAVAYFRFPTALPTRVSLVMAKTKVAPVKTMSIPRLELEAAKLGARLAASVEKLHSIPIKKRYFLSDSKCVLSWINSKRFDFVPFVAHRISEILDLTTPVEWFYVPTNENVADDGTKDTSLDKDSSSSRWFRGAEFLQSPVETWPTESPRDDVVHAVVGIHRQPSRFPNGCADHFLNHVAGRFQSDWEKLIRVTARVLRAICNFKEMTRSSDVTLTVRDLASAEKEILRFIQRESFEGLWNELANETEQGNSAETFFATGGTKSWPVFMETGEKLIRLMSRDRSSPNSFSAKNLILLPKGHKFVRLYLQHLHERNDHIGIEGTIAEAREKVWIIAARQALLSVIANCQSCKNRKVNPILPTMGNLHQSRTAFDQKPFTFVGVDCFGPIAVKERRSVVKRWGVIFTCLTYRAVHLEVVVDVSADQMLLAVRRLISRRGPVKIMFSDNGTNFVGANKIVREEVKEAQRQLGESAAKNLSLEWRFIPAYSPWMGGAWERLIGYIKKCIKFCLAGETPSDAVLNNAMIEAELITNKRPLTHTPIDPDDDEPLTPNMALFGVSDAPQAICPDEIRNKFAKLSRRRVAHLVQKFKHRWEKEYLPLIARKEQSLTKHRHVIVGDVVLLTEGEANRENWKLGRIINIHPTSDQVPRIVDVRMGTGEIKQKRAVGNLAVLEVSSSTSP